MSRRQQEQRKQMNDGTPLVVIQDILFDEVRNGKPRQEFSQPKPDISNQPKSDPIPLPVPVVYEKDPAELNADLLMQQQYRLQQQKIQLDQQEQQIKNTRSANRTEDENVLYARRAMKTVVITLIVYVILYMLMIFTKSKVSNMVIVCISLSIGCGIVYAKMRRTSSSIQKVISSSADTQV